MSVGTRNRVDRSKLARRTEAINYREDLERRFGYQPTMLDMAVVTSGTPDRKPYQVAERIALIEICGVLCNDPCWYDETGYDEIQFEAQTAADDADVDGILLLCNTPGGDTDNAFETADILKAAAAKKPMFAVAAPFAYSSGYLLASQASQIYVSPITGGVGSIGVYALHLDYSGYLAKAGIKPTLISAGEGKASFNPYEPLSKDAFDALKAEVNRLYGEFVMRVATGRKMSESAIIKLGAKLFEGSKSSLGAGLADRVGSPETAWLDLAARAAAAKNGLGPAAAEGQLQIEGETIMEPTNGAAATGQENKTPPPAAPGTGAAALVGTAATAPDLNAIRTEARESGFADAEVIVNICSLSGNAGLALGFIKARTPIADVTKALIEEKAKKGAAGGEIRGGVLPHEAANTDKPAKSLKQMNEEKLRKEGVLK